MRQARGMSSPPRPPVLRALLVCTCCAAAPHRFVTAKDYYEPGIEGLVATLEMAELARLVGAAWARPRLGNYNKWLYDAAGVDWADVWEPRGASVSAEEWAATGGALTTVVLLDTKSGDCATVAAASAERAALYASKNAPASVPCSPAALA